MRKRIGNKKSDLYENIHIPLKIIVIPSMLSTQYRLIALTKKL